MRRIPGLSGLLDGEIVALHRYAGHSPDAIAGWGIKPSARRAIAHARRAGLPYLGVEDGFLRSVGLGRDEAPLSLVVDDLGIYYDASRPSRLEAFALGALDDAASARAMRLMTLWRDERVSKYNHARDPGVPGEPYVLVVDQTAGDASISAGQADARSFARMLEAARDEHPQARVLLKVHPEVVAGRKRGHYDLARLGRDPRIGVLGDDSHPALLLAQATVVYTVTSQVGFEALLWGRPVRVFGMPFYGGWGLTGDDRPAPARRSPIPLPQLVHAALVAYPRYRDPETGQRCEVERVLAYIGLQRRMRQRFAPRLYGCGFSAWKRPIVRRFFWGSDVCFVPDEARVPAGQPRIVWGARPEVAHEPAAGECIRLEDGFLRSVGLGADLVNPLSWVADRRGMYYHADAPSDLEHVLAQARFTPELLDRARELRRRINELKLTKYNVGARRWERHGVVSQGGDHRVVLVTGQVESDASIRFGSVTTFTNMDLLRSVHEENRGAYILYKPHPDVVAGLRRRGLDEDRHVRWCDEVIIDAAMGDLLEEVDEVHVLTSLAGFEALLRGKSVTTYGMPFYAGWGLTRDRGMTPEVAARRQRRLTLDELVAGTLILYPVYVSRVTGRYTTPERALDELVEWRRSGGSALGWWRRLLRLALRLRAR